MVKIKDYTFRSKLIFRKRKRSLKKNGRKFAKMEKIKGNTLRSK
jgi:hypothetical protein